jgi:chromosome segregation ATPase
MRSSQSDLRQQCAALTAKVGKQNDAAQEKWEASTASQKKQKVGGGLLTVDGQNDLAMSNIYAELSSAQDEIESLRQHVAEYRQLAELREEEMTGIQQLEQKKAEDQLILSTKCSTALVQHQKLQTELLEAKAAISASVVAKQTYEMEIGTLKNAVASAQAHAKSLEEQMQAYDESLSVSQAKLSKLQQTEVLSRAENLRLEAVANQVTAAYAETSAAQACLAETEAAAHERHKSLQNKLSVSTTELRDVRAQNEMLLGQLDRAMGNMGASTASWAGAAASWAGGTTDDDGVANGDPATVIEGLREVMKNVREARDLAESRLELTQQEGQRHKAQVQVLERELGALRTQMASRFAGSSTPRSATPRSLAEPDTQVHDTVDELRANRDRITAQLVDSEQARKNAEAGQAGALAARDEADIAKRRIEGLLFTAKQEAKMWQTKLNTSTERAKLLKLQKELTEKNQ